MHADMLMAGMYLAPAGGRLEVRELAMCWADQTAAIIRLWLVFCVCRVMPARLCITNRMWMGVHLHGSNEPVISVHVEGAYGGLYWGEGGRWIRIYRTLADLAVRRAVGR